MSEEWEWDNRDEIEHIPRWVELLLVIVDFPIVMVSVVVIIFPTLNLTNGLISVSRHRVCGVYHQGRFCEG